MEAIAHVYSTIVMNKLEEYALVWAWFLYVRLSISATNMIKLNT